MLKLQYDISMANSFESTIEAEDAGAIERGIRREKYINGFAKVTQFLTWPFLFCLFHVLFKIKINGRENFSLVRRPFILISNHISTYDSFLFRLVLGLWTPHLPLRFMAVTKFNWSVLNFLSAIGVIEFIYALFGVFTIVPGLGYQKNLEEARDIIRAGGNVVVFPEGKIVWDDGTDHDVIAPFKKGAANLMVMTGAPVVPVAFHVTPSWFRKKIVINIGEPIMGLERSTVPEATEYFHKRMEELYEKPD